FLSPSSLEMASSESSSPYAYAKSGTQPGVSFARSVVNVDDVEQTESVELGSISSVDILVMKVVSDVERVRFVVEDNLRSGEGETYESAHVNVGSESRPPMLYKENYVPWSSRLLRYAKSRPNGKLIHNSIFNGPYVRRMIAEPSDGERSGTLPSNTIANPKEELKGITTRSGVAYQGPTNSTPSKVVKQGTKVTKDQVQTPSSQSTAPVQPPVSQSKIPTPVSEPVVASVSAPMPNMKSFISYPSRRDNERRRDQANEQIEQFYEIFKDMSFEISFTDALILMPKFASTLKALIGNKE
nr:reverse transcriptase domain-containing protein [Tanacetum cinerariifolium]